MILLFIAIQLASAYILMGVFEEKSTKVVELVLSSIRARCTCWLGKIIGVGVLGVVQVVCPGRVRRGRQLRCSGRTPCRR